jgi:hypothetical protein
MTNDFTFLNSIKNKNLLKHLEIRALTKRDFQTILEILQNNSYSLLLKVCVEEEKFVENSRQFITDWLKEKTHLANNGEASPLTKCNVLSVIEIHPWVTIEFECNSDLV